MKEKKLPNEYISKALQLYVSYITEEEKIDKKYSDKIGGRDDRGESERYCLSKKLRKDLKMLQSLFPTYFGEQKQ